MTVGLQTQEAAAQSLNIMVLLQSGRVLETTRTPIWMLRAQCLSSASLTVLDADSSLPARHAPGGRRMSCRGNCCRFVMLRRGCRWLETKGRSGSTIRSKPVDGIVAHPVAACCGLGQGTESSSPFTHGIGAPLDRRGGPLFSRSEARLPAESRQLGSLESRRTSSSRQTPAGTRRPT